MRPTPGDVASGVARILHDTVLPAVDDEHAAAQLRQIITTLGQVDWNEAAFALATRDRQLVALLHECQAWVGDESPEPTSFAELAAQHTKHRGMLDAFLTQLAQHRAGGDARSSDAAVQKIRTYLAGTA
jgi:hypothetical protein